MKDNIVFVDDAVPDPYALNIVVALDPSERPITTNIFAIIFPISPFKPLNSNKNKDRKNPDTPKTDSDLILNVGINLLNAIIKINKYPKL